MGKQTTRSKNSQSMDELDTYELDDTLPNTDPQATKPKRPKRSKKSVNENLELAFTAVSKQTEYPPRS